MMRKSIREKLMKDLKPQQLGERRDFKLGVKVPSKASLFRENLRKNKLTGRQKLELTRSRIFDTRIHDGFNHNINKFGKRTDKAAAEFSPHKDGLSALHPHMKHPMLRDQTYDGYRRQLFESRKLRLMMRGVKVGRKKGGGRVNLASVFQTGSGNKENEGT